MPSEPYLEIGPGRDMEIPEDHQLSFVRSQPRSNTIDHQPSLIHPSDGPGYQSADGRYVPSLQEFAREYDVRAMTPREMVDLSYDLYSAGYVNQDLYKEMSFQSELMPNFDVTIGALTGQKADPDRPRDYTEIWLAKVRFENDHIAENNRAAERADKILQLLNSISEQDISEPKTGKKRELFGLIPPLSLRGGN